MENTEEILCLSNSALEFRPMNPWMKLVFSVFGGSFSTNRFVIDHIEQITKKLLSSLTPCESWNLAKQFGLDYYPKEVLVTDSPVMSEMQKQTVEKALRKMRHPSRASLLRGSTSPIRSGLLNYDANIAYYQKMEDIIKEELAGVLERRPRKYVYITKVLEKGCITLQCRNNSMTSMRKIRRSLTLEELNLSVRTLNMLKRAGIQTSEEFFARIDENPDFLYDIREKNRKSAEELERFLHNCTQGNTLQDDFTAVDVVRGSEKTTYKFLTDDIRKIADSIYLNELQQNTPDSTVIGSGTFSPGLANILLMMGYFYMDNILADSDSLIQKLIAAGFDDFAEELSMYQHFESYLKENGAAASEYVIIYSPKIATLARENQCETVSKFKLLLEKNGFFEELNNFNRTFDISQENLD